MTGWQRTAVVIGAVVGLVVVASGAAQADVGTTSLVSVSSTGTPGNAASYGPNGSMMSADGRYVVFLSDATNLVPGHTNHTRGVFVRDRKTGTTSRVDVSTSGADGDGPCFDAAISPDGRYVAFNSSATNLVPGLANGLSAFVRDRKAGTTSWVSMSSTGAQGNGDVYGVAISADGRYVAFTADSTNLVPGDTNASWDIFVRDRKARTTSRVSVSGTGAQANDNSFLPAISADGRYVLFDSSATNLVPGHTDSQGGVFVRDRKAGTTSRVDVSSTGAQGNNDGFGGAMSPDGRYVAFISFATNLVPGDTNGVSDVFVRDRTARTTSLVSVSGAGKQENGFAEDVGISPDGRYVAFTSGATNLVPGDTNDARDVFLRDRTARTTTRVSVSRTGAQGNGLSYGPAAIGADGRYVAFSSVASNLVPGDTNGTVDVFVRDTRPAR